MKNPKRAEELRKQIVLFLGTEEAKDIFENIEFKENDKILAFGDNISIDAYEKSAKECIVRFQNNTNDGQRQYNVTIKV